MRVRKLLILMGVAAGVAAGGAISLRHTGQPEAPRGLEHWVRPGAGTGFNVLLITLDTVRRDHLGCYGRRQAQTPTCDSLLEHGVRFDDAVTSVPITLPSHATLMTGLYPHHHGVRDNGKYRLASRQQTLAELLKARGYDTAAFVGCFVLDARFGLDQGFDIYDFEVTEEGYRREMVDYNERPANAVTDAALGWFERRQAAGTSTPFFVWVHYFDAHLPYRSPLASQPRFAGRPYDAEIAFVDQQLKRLLDQLGELGLQERTVIVLVSDHGESLGEHGEPTHGMLLYEATVRVPFIISCPALFQGPHYVDGQVVGLVDVRPTLEDLLGVTPLSPTDGRSLLAPAAVPERAVYLETYAPFEHAGWSPLYGARTQARKYILAPTPEYYDLTADQGEQRNRYADDDPELVRLKAALGEWMKDSGTRPGSGRAVSDEELRRLGSLGYVQAGGGVQQTTLLADPKTMMPVYNESARAERLYTQGRFEEAADLARHVLDQCESCGHARRVLAFSFLKLGRAAEGIAVLRESPRQGSDVFLIRSLAEMLILNQQYDSAEEVLDLYTRVAPLDGRVPLLRGDILLRRHRPEEALAQYEEALRLDEHRAGPQARERIEHMRKQ